MMNATQINAATLEQLNAELAAGGMPSGEIDLTEARKSVRSLIAEFSGPKKYTINSECGVMRGYEAADIYAAKQKYEQDFHFDFDGADNGEYPGSWYWIEENGVRVADLTECMP